ncbi:MAG: DUF192 domain-containing protein [Alphaproteobacteria bacterium]|nr:DUF192 domain-containing protein [Alphaproteobacteria bacterium]
MQNLSIKSNCRFWVLCAAIMIAGIIALPKYSLAGNLSENNGNFQTGKKYPLTITHKSGGAVNFQVEHAISESEHNQGLMYRTSLPENGGMIFIYKTAQKVQFWMKNTIIPLDMIFIDAGGEIISIHENAVPLSLTAIDSGGKIVAVLEIAGGMAARNYIAVGDHVKF